MAELVAGLSGGCRLIVLQVGSELEQVSRSEPLLELVHQTGRKTEDDATHREEGRLGGEPATQQGTLSPPQAGGCPRAHITEVAVRLTELTCVGRGHGTGGPAQLRGPAASPARLSHAPLVSWRCRHARSLCCQKLPGRVWVSCPSRVPSVPRRVLPEEEESVSAEVKPRRLGERGWRG